MKTQFTILLVEDNHHVAKAAAHLLKRAGYAVTLAATGVEGLQLARSMHPDALVLDGELPGMDGFEVCRRLKGDDATRHIPILFFSGQPYAQALSEQAGADDFLAKPDEAGQLGERLARLLGR